MLHPLAIPPLARSIAMCAALAALHLAGHAAESATPANQFHTAPRQAGQVMLEHPGGEFIYGTTANDRARTKAFTIGKKTELRDVIPSAQEEAATQLAQAVQTITETPPTKPLRKVSQPRPRIDWPKVVVMGDEVCVPVLAKSESNDWQSHLTCVEVKQ